jgi:hypothetical protein
MNTPAHAVINLLILSRGCGHRHSAAIVGGALIPDIAIILFYAWHLALGTAEAEIWSLEYYRPLWQGWIDSFNSIPLIALAILICWRVRQYLMLLFFTSMLLHVFADLPLHHDDAHRHFFPLSDWRFASPVSYWDPAFHGERASLVEFVVVMAASLFMYQKQPHLRNWVMVTVAVYLVYWIYVYLVWM